jgi:hypothetical protein
MTAASQTRGMQASSSRVIYTARVANNSEVFRDILEYYVPVGSAVADLTWGRGIFWRGVDQENYLLTRIDKFTEVCHFKLLSALVHPPF